MTIKELFEKHPWLPKKLVAERTGIRADVMRQYANGDKEPSYTRRQHILNTVRELGQELASITTK